MAKYTTGNIQLHNRPQYVQPDGSVSTVNSMSFNDGQGEVLIPTVDYDNQGVFRQLSNQEAIQRYQDTGRYLGRFPDIDSANLYAERLHNQQQNEINQQNNIDEATRNALVQLYLKALLQQKGIR